MEDNQAPRRPLLNDQEWCSPQGMNLSLCVAHELDPDEQYSVQAIVVFQGDSLCREHLEHYSTR
jgi:hypothetical protein